MQKTIKSLKDTIEKLWQILDNKTHFAVLLNGDLASGKTYLVKKYVKKISSRDDNVTSSTFSLVHEYDNNIFHYDLYRKDMNELMQMGIFEMIANEGIHFIEWPDEFLKKTIKDFNIPHINIDILLNDNTREYKIYE